MSARVVGVARRFGKSLKRPEDPVGDLSEDFRAMAKARAEAERMLEDVRQVQAWNDSNGYHRPDYHIYGSSDPNVPRYSATAHTTSRGQALFTAFGAGGYKPIKLETNPPDIDGRWRITFYEITLDWRSFVGKTDLVRMRNMEVPVDGVPRSHAMYPVTLQCPGIVTEVVWGPRPYAVVVPCTPQARWEPVNVPVSRRLPKGKHESRPGK